MSKKLFVTAPITKASRNAIVGGPHASRYAYIHAYFEAATVLANTSLKNGVKDLLFYPILFNYRHYLELHLKSLIVGAEQLYFVMDELGDAKGKLNNSVQSQLDSIHSIECLFRLFEERLTLVSQEIFDPGVRKTIMQLHNRDPDGQVFRYHERTSKKPSMPDVEQCDLQNIQDRMKEVHDLLFGVDLWLDHYYGMASSILESMEPEDC
jgi:hypothetical protein